MSRHRVSPSPFLSLSSSLKTQLHYTNSYTYSHSNLNFLQHYTDTLPRRNVVCPSGARFENRPHSMPSIRLVRYPKRIIVQWVGIRTHTQIFLSGQRQRFQNDRETEMSVTQWLQSQTADLYYTGYKKWSHGMTNVLIPEVNTLVEQ